MYVCMYVCSIYMYYSCIYAYIMYVCMYVCMYVSMCVGTYYIIIYSTLPLFLWQQLGIIFHILTGSFRFCRFWNIYPRSCKNDVSYKLPCLQCKLLDMFTNNIPCLQ